MIKKSSMILLSIVLIAISVACEDNEIDVEIKCLESSSGTTCEASPKDNITSPKTSIGKVTNSNSEKIDTINIVEFNIDNTKTTIIKFMPAGIKKKFPKLNSITMTFSALTHLERDDMRQFGNDLIKLKLSNNALTALQGDLFHFNNDLEEIDLSENPLKFIGSAFFITFKKMFRLKNVSMNNSGCIDQASSSPNPKIFKWNMEKCVDEDAEKLNLIRNRSRAVFLIRECLDQCTCTTDRSEVCSRSCVSQYCEGTLKN